jgi:hypothetical protein
VGVSRLELLRYGAGDSNGDGNDDARRAYPTLGRSCSPLAFCYENCDATYSALFGLSS